MFQLKYTLVLQLSIELQIHMVRKPCLKARFVQQFAGELLIQNTYHYMINASTVSIEDNNACLQENYQLCIECEM